MTVKNGETTGGVDVDKFIAFYAIGGSVLEFGGPARFYATLALPHLVALLSVMLIRSSRPEEDKTFAQGR